jgi:hypothetical protein
MRRTAALVASAALLVGGVIGALGARAAGSDPEPGARSSVATLFVVASSPANLNSNEGRPETVFTGTLTVVNAGGTPQSVSSIAGGSLGVTITGTESPPRAIPPGGQNLVSVRVVVPNTFCSSGQITTAFAAPIPLTLTVQTSDAATRTESLSLELAGTAWDDFVRERCFRLAEAGATS